MSPRNGWWGTSLVECESLDSHLLSLELCSLSTRKLTQSLPPSLENTLRTYSDCSRFFIRASSNSSSHTFHTIAKSFGKGFTSSRHFLLRQHIFYRYHSERECRSIVLLILGTIVVESNNIINSRWAPAHILLQILCLTRAR